VATVIGCLPTQAIAFEWKPGLRCRGSASVSSSPTAVCRRQLHALVVRELAGEKSMGNESDRGGGGGGRAFRFRRLHQLGRRVLLFH